MNSKTITKNSFWYGVETLSGLFLTVFTSIVIARTFGPERLGYFLYLWWIAGIAGTLGGLGIPGATRKYMSEYFGRGQMGIAKTVFYRTLRLQTFMAAVITLAGLLGIWFFGDRQYRIIGLFMIGSIFPFMVNSIAAGANNALEDLRANVPASLVSTGIFVTAVFSSIYFGWGLLGISVGLLAMRTAELVVRFIPLVKRFDQHSAEPIDRILNKRMFLFSRQSLILLMLGLIVWDRSEMVFLKHFCADIRQVAFYSVAFNMTERLLVFSQVFGTATGATMMVQYGRDSSRVRGHSRDLGTLLGIDFFSGSPRARCNCRPARVGHIRQQVFGSCSGACSGGMPRHSKSLLHSRSSSTVKLGTSGSDNPFGIGFGSSQSGA